jgi:predicted cupin superfamily sugar epimerase
MTPNDIITHFGLEPHRPTEGGYFRRTYEQHR